MVIDRVIHMPGVRETKKKVGMNTPRKVELIKGSLPEGDRYGLSG